MSHPTKRSTRAWPALLDASPTDSHIYYRTALLLGRLGDRHGAARHLDRVAHRLASEGQLLLALAAARELASYGAEQADQCIQAIAAIYGRGSDRLEARRESVPPPLPARAQQEDRPEDLDPRVLREAALDACEKAARIEIDVERKVAFHPLLCELSAEELVSLVPLMQPCLFVPGDVVVEQGTEGTAIFILVYGTLKVTRQTGGESVALATLNPGSFFGEMALLTESPRSAQVTCETESLVFRIQHADLERLASKNEQVATVLANYSRRRLLRNLMGTSVLFRSLDPARRESLVELFESVVLEPGEMVVQEGQRSCRLYVVLTGAVEVSKREAGEVLRLAELGPGQLFGEISLIKDREATATVRALCKTVLLGLSRGAFNSHVSEFPEVLAHIYQVALDREETNLQLQSSDSVDVEEDLLI